MAKIVSDKHGEAEGFVRIKLTNDRYLRITRRYFEEIGGLDGIAKRYESETDFEADNG